VRYASAAWAPGTCKRPLRILVVDDDDERRELVRSAAQIAFHGAPLRLSAAAGGEGAAIAASQAPDLVLLPGTRGRDDLAWTLQRLRVVDRSGAMRAVAINPREPGSIEAGANAVIARPLELGALVAGLRELAAEWGWLPPSRRSSRPPPPPHKG
jgi:CheY-like chemotaxis protein